MYSSKETSLLEILIMIKSNQIQERTSLSPLKDLSKLLESKTIFKLGHNLKYDRNVLLNYGIDVQGILFDSMLESYVLDSTGSRHGLDKLAFKYLDGRATTKYEEVVGKGAKQINFSQVSLDVAADYAAEDAEVSYQLHAFFQEELMKDDFGKHPRVQARSTLDQLVVKGLDEKQTNLKNWARLKEKYPNTFGEMYQFWVCKTKN